MIEGSEIVTAPVDPATEMPVPAIIDDTFMPPTARVIAATYTGLVIG
jgi:hypothetical protein